MPYDSYYTAAFFICLVLFTDFLKDNKSSANSNFYNFGLHGCCFKRERKMLVSFCFESWSFFRYQCIERNFALQKFFC